MVFDPAAAPRERTKFLAWYEKQAEWQESHGYNNPDVPSPALTKWFREIIKTFPPMNGPLAGDDPDDPKVTDYSLGRSVIYGAFAWSEAEAAYKHVKELAAKHGVGFFDASGEDGAIWWPVEGWKLCGSLGRHSAAIDLAFEEVLNKLDPKKNSFYILEHDNGNYMQCDRAKATCTVEFRTYESPKKYKHYVVGHADGSTATASVKMSGGGVSVHKGEVLNAAEAAELFALFFAGKKFPKKYAVREKDV